MRPNLENNIKKLSRKLGFDMINFTPNWKIVQKLMLRSFLDKGDFLLALSHWYFFISNVDCSWKKNST